MVRWGGGIRVSPEALHGVHLENLCDQILCIIRDFVPVGRRERIVSRLDLPGEIQRGRKVGKRFSHWGDRKEKSAIFGEIRRIRG